MLDDIGCRSESSEEQEDSDLVALLRSSGVEATCFNQHVEIVDLAAKKEKKCNGVEELYVTDGEDDDAPREFRQTHGSKTSWTPIAIL